MSIFDDRDDPFAHAAEEGLHGPPVEPSGPTSRGNRAWVVFNGRKLGVFETWEATGAQVNGFPNGLQRGFKTYNEARSAWLHGRVNDTIGPPPPPMPPLASIPVFVAPHSLTPPPAIPHVSTTRNPPKGASVGGLQGRSTPVASTSPQRPVPAVSQPFPSVSTPPPRHDKHSTGRRPAPHPMSISDEDAYWVVTRGEHPGVYHGRIAASAALGLRGFRHVIKAGSRDQADRTFTNQYMRGDIDEIVNLNALGAFEALENAMG